MKLYSATIRLGGNTDNQVQKDNMSAAELKILEFVHAGKASVLADVKHTADVDRTDAKERARLASIYSKGTQNEFLTGRALVEKLFGVAGIPLPVEYVAPTFEPIETVTPEGDSDEIIVPVKTDTKKKTSSLAELTG